MSPVLWILTSLLLFAAGEAASKLWVANHRWTTLVLMFAAYLACEVPWLFALRQKNHLTSLGTIWSVGAVLCSVLLGVLVFKEPVSAKQAVGIILALAACWLLC